MRIDKFLNSVNLTKRRAIAQDMIDQKVISINGAVSKASKNVKVGDIITITFLEYIKKYEVLDIPKIKTVPKTAQSNYIKELL